MAVSASATCFGVSFIQIIFQLQPAGNESHELSILTVLGDSSGLVDINSSQTFYIEYTAAVDRRSVPPVNFHVSRDATVFLPADFRIIGDMDPPFYLDGQMMGVYNLTVGESRELQIGVHATSIQINNGSYLSTPQAGILLEMQLLLEKKKIF